MHLCPPLTPEGEAETWWRQNASSKLRNPKRKKKWRQHYIVHYAQYEVNYAEYDLGRSWPDFTYVRHSSPQSSKHTGTIRAHPSRCLAGRRALTHVSHAQRVDILIITREERINLYHPSYNRPSLSFCHSTTACNVDSVCR